MKKSIIIPALLRLLEYTSTKRFNLKNKEINFDDEIGQKAISINNDIKTKYNIDIFSPDLRSEQLSRFEGLISHAMSNYAKNKLVPRKLNDEIEILKDSKAFNNTTLSSFNIIFSISLLETISKFKYITSDELLDTIKEPDLVSYLPGEDLSSQYFFLSKMSINKRDYYIISTLRHETRKEHELAIVSFVALLENDYSQFKNNPTQLFLKGLDIYGVDLKINNSLSRYYKKVVVPLNTKMDSVEFLNIQNIDKNESFVLAMGLTKTSNSIKLENVFAIKTEKLIAELNK